MKSIVHVQIVASPFVLGPLPPAEAQQVFLSNDPRTIEVSWLPPASGRVDGYRVSLNSSDGLSFNTTRNEGTWTQLLPGISYAVSIESYVEGPEGLVLSRVLKKSVMTRRIPDDPTVNLVAVATAPELTLEASDNSVRFLEAKYVVFILHIVFRYVELV